MSERERPLMYSQEEAQYEDLPPSWPFEIREVDQLRAERRIESGFKGTDVVILGPPQAGVPGIRLLGPIVEMAQALEIMRQHGLGMPNPKIFCPIHINSSANGVSTEANEAMAGFYGELARRYFATFHPELPLPEVVLDSPALVAQVAQRAQLFAQGIPPDVRRELMEMSNNHAAHGSQKDAEVKAAGYLLAHYLIYDWTGESYIGRERPALFLVPHSETRFEGLMNRAAPAARAAGLKVVEPSDDPEGSRIVGYSRTIRTPHYYPHSGEPTLAACINQWPRPSAIRGGIRGLNGYAQKEIASVIELIEADISVIRKDNVGRKHSWVDIPTLQKEVLLPLAAQIYCLTDELQIGEE